MPTLLLILAVALSLVFLFLLWKYSYWYRRGIPQGNPLKLLCDYNDFMITFYPYIQHYLALGRKFADKPYYGVYAFGSPRLFIRDPDMLKDILTTKFSSFYENGFHISEEDEPIVGRDPFFKKGGDDWKESRANFSSVMTPARLRNAMLPEIVTVSKEAVDYLRGMKHESGRGDGANVKDFALRYMTNVLIRVLLSLDAGSFKPEKSPFLQQAQAIFDTGIDSVFKTFIFFIAPQLSTLLGHSFVNSDHRTFFEDVIKKQKLYRNDNGIKRDDILNLVLKKASEMKGSGGKSVDVDLEALALVIMFFVEGFETSATTTSSTMVTLAKHEEIQENLRRQILEACPRGKEITEEALNNMPLLQNCISETLRLCPPGLIMQRVATEDTTLIAKTGDKLSLKKGDYLNIPVVSIHRDPEFFPDPDAFDPDRFDDELQKRFYLGFGDGPRQCPGQKFAALAIKAVIASVLREFKLELSPKTKYPIQSINHSFLFSLRDIRARFVPL